MKIALILCFLFSPLVAPRSLALANESSLTAQCERLLAKAADAAGRTPVDGPDTTGAYQTSLRAWNAAHAVCGRPGVAIELRIRGLKGYAQVLRAESGLTAVEELYRAELASALRGEHGHTAASISAIYLSLVSVLEEQQRFDGALSIQLDAIRHAERAFGPRTRQMATELVMLGYLHQLRGESAVAEQTYRKAIDVATGACASKCEELSQAWSFLADLLRAQPARVTEMETARARAEEAFPEQ